MDFAIDRATAQRMERLADLGRDHMRPLGIEADRLGRPIPPDHPYFAMLVAMGMGRTRWRPGGRKPNADDARTNSPLGRGVGSVLVAEEQSYWDRGVSVATPGPGLGEGAVISMGTPEQQERFLSPSSSRTGRAGPRSP